MKQSINLLPQKSPLEVQVKKRKQTTYVFLGLGLVVLFLMWLVPFVILQAVKREEQNLLSEITTKEQSIKSLAKVEENYRTVLSKASVAALVLRKKSELRNDIEKVTRLAGEDLTIAKIVLSKKSLGMTIDTENLEAFANYLRVLEQETTAAMFQTLTLSGFSVDRTSAYRAEIKGELKNEN